MHGVWDTLVVGTSSRYKYFTMIVVYTTGYYIWCSRIADPVNKSVYTCLDGRVCAFPPAGRVTLPFLFSFSVWVAEGVSLPGSLLRAAGSDVRGHGGEPGKENGEHLLPLAAVGAPQPGYHSHAGADGGLHGQ